MKILIVEDSDSDFELIIRLLVKIFRSAGIKEEIIYDCAKNKNDAIKMINEGDYKMVTLDGNLENNGSSISVLEKIDSKFLKKIVGISDDQSFLDYCLSKSVLICHKGLLISHGKEDSSFRFLPIVNKIFQST